MLFSVMIVYTIQVKEGITGKKSATVFGGLLDFCIHMLVLALTVWKGQLHRSLLSAVFPPHHIDLFKWANKKINHDTALGKWAK